MYVAAQQSDRRWNSSTPVPTNKPAKPKDSGFSANTQTPQQQQPLPSYNHQDQHNSGNDHHAQDQERHDSLAGPDNGEQNHYGADMTEEQILAEIEGKTSNPRPLVYQSIQATRKLMHVRSDLKQTIPARMTELANILT